MAFSSFFSSWVKDAPSLPKPISNKNQVLCLLKPMIQVSWTLPLAQCHSPPRYTSEFLIMVWGCLSDHRGFPSDASGKSLPANTRGLRDTGSIPWKSARKPTPVFLPGESHGQGSLAVATVLGSQSWTQLKRLSMHTYSRKASPVTHVGMLYFRAPEWKWPWDSQVMRLKWVTFSHTHTFWERQDVD